MELDNRTEEDKIIEILQIEGGTLYEDLDFIPGRQSLYDLEDFVPVYDEEIVQNIVWKRPTEVHESVDYFTESLQCPSGVQGSLSDEVFLGTLLGVGSYIGQDLVQNIIASRPEDFREFGVFTCRFYVEGEWVDVITDTRIPYLQDSYGNCTPVYGRSSIPEEMWICLIEKAYAKAVGSYEALQKVKINEALLHLTGGSVQQFNLQDELRLEEGFYSQWKSFKDMLAQDTLILALPASIQESAELASGESKDRVTKEDMQRAGIVPDRLYSVLAFKQIGNHELLMLCNPWGHVRWQGLWAESSVKWDDFPEVLHAIEADPAIAWRRDDPLGYIWMTFKEFSNYFNTIYACKIFSNEKFRYYCIKGEWKDQSAGGPMHSVRDREVASRAALESLQQANRNATAALAIDGDTAWFTNPQYKVTTTAPVSLYISILPYGNEAENAPVVAVDVVSLPRPCQQTTSRHIWDCTYVEQVATEKVFLAGRIKGQEASVWNVQLQPKTPYFIIPHTMRKGIQGHFILRIHALGPIVIEHLGLMHSDVLSGEWRRSTESDTTGGPLTLPSGGKNDVDNPKWCQNPQYHFELNNPYVDSELNIKFVIKRTDKHNAGKAALQAAASGGDKADTHVGLVVCRAEYLEDSQPLAKNGGKKPPRKNAFGEIIEPKASTLKNSSSSKLVHESTPRTLLRKVVLKPDEFRAMSTFSAKNESCIYVANVPHIWMKNGLLFIPCLSEKAIRGNYELEVFCSEPFSLKLIPDNSIKCIAGEWGENLSGGSHVCPSWKKNPKYTLRLRSLSASAFKIRIALQRVGSGWAKGANRDKVNTMIGFYVFINKGGELVNVLETPFVASDEVTTEPEFALEPLSDDEVYTIMPTTYGENHRGAFVLTVMSTECDFSFTKESTKSEGHHHHK